MIAKLVVLTGLPGTGKSAIAEAVGQHLQAPVFAKDRIEAPLLRSGAVARDQLGALGYDLLTTLADRQLVLGQSAVLDSVASTTSIRSTWQALARQHGARWYVIECVCSDVTVHQERLNGRDRGIPGWPELEWSEVEGVRNYYAPWDEPRLTLDATVALADNIDRAIAYISQPAV